MSSVSGPSYRVYSFLNASAGCTLAARSTGRKLARAIAAARIASTAANKAGEPARAVGEIRHIRCRHHGR
jgi:hypothetical protein